MAGTPSGKSVVSVTEMARLCGLSRSRFYCLIHDGVMPLPSRHPATDRPHYTREQQEQCLAVRRTNCGINGQPMLFYAARTKSPPTGKPGKNHVPPVGGKENPVIAELRHGLEQLGITDASDDKIRAAVAATHPDGHAGISTPALLMAVFHHLKTTKD